MAKKAAHITAAETALGLDPIGLETKPEALLRRKWERYFAPLGLALPPQQPPLDMWYRIQGALDRAGDQHKIKRAQSKLNGWRWATAGATALAAGLAAFIVTKTIDTDPPPAAETKYIAVITPEDSKTAMIVEFDLEAGIASVRPVAVSAPAGKSLQMWTAAPGDDPRPVGLVKPDSINRFDLNAKPGDAIAVSVEPEGGSPTGSPTGDVVYHGFIVAVPE